MIAQSGRVEISTRRLHANLDLLRARLGERTGICATVKANAYGHGAAQVLPLLEAAHVPWLCVYSLTEAAETVALTKRAKVLVLAPVVMREGEALSGAEVKAMTHERVRISVTDADSARHLALALSPLRLQRPVLVHVQVDTGLTRAGADADGVVELAGLIDSLNVLKVEGIFSHLSHGDEPGHATVAAQLERLRAVAGPLRRQNPKLLVHLQNSGGAWHAGDLDLDFARVGIALYGLQPSLADRIDQLQPIARVVAPVLAIHERPAGTGVGYGHTFTTTRQSRLGIVPVGYGDGYPRQLSNRSVVQLAGGTAPVVGRVSMDQIVIDLTDLPKAGVGEPVTVVSDRSADANSLDSLAAATGTIPYELATSLNRRLERVTIA